jgi:autoaggregation protein RapA/B/C
MVKPVADNDYSVISVQDIDQTISGNLLANDVNPDGGALFLRFVNGIRVGDKGTDTIQGTYGTFTFRSDGTYDYVLDTSDPAVMALAPGEKLTESLNYKISDGTGETDFGLFALEITGPNQRPTAVQDNFTMAVGDDLITGNILLNDTDPDGGTLQVSFIGEDSPLTYIANDGGTVSYQGEHGTITIGRDGDFSYDVDETDPDVMALAPGETLMEHFVYKIWDGGVTNSADQDNIFIRISADDI